MLELDLKCRLNELSNAMIPPNLNLPGWAAAFALFLLLVGLPIMLATVFVQERPTVSEALDAEAVLAT